jgi:hypothetical protein
MKKQEHNCISCKKQKVKILNYAKNSCLALDNHKINVIMKKQVHEIGVLQIADQKYVPLLY